MTGTVYFTHRFGCQKCLVEGKILEKRMCFPLIGVELRTDANFRQPNENNPAEKNHIKKHSILTELPVDLVKSFIIADSLHFLELGNMKKYEQNIERDGHIVWDLCVCVHLSLYVSYRVYVYIVFMCVRVRLTAV